MTKRDLIMQVAEKIKVKQKDVAMVLQNWIAIIKNRLGNNKGVHIRGFGSFVIVRKARRVARNIRAGKKHIIPAHYGPKFQPSKALRKKIKALA